MRKDRQKKKQKKTLDAGFPGAWQPVFKIVLHHHPAYAPHTFIVRLLCECVCWREGKSPSSENWFGEHLEVLPCLHQRNLHGGWKVITGMRGKRGGAVTWGGIEFWVLCDAIIEGLHLKLSALNRQSSTWATEEQAATLAKCIYGVC